MSDTSVTSATGMPLNQVTVTTSSSSQSQTQDGYPTVLQISCAKTYHFEAAHFLPKHEGKCRRLHGHNYRVEVTCRGSMAGLHRDDGSAGMVKDFYDIDQDLQKVIGPWDHRLINDYIFNPTAENMALSILLQLRSLDQRYSKVTVWETDDCYATASA